MCLGKLDKCLSVASFCRVQTHREAQGTRRASMGRTFFWFGFLYANKENERPPRQWLSKLNLDTSRNKKSLIKISGFSNQT